MLTLELDMYQACALGALVYCLGRLLVQKLPFLSKYCIPAPVAGFWPCLGICFQNSR